MPTLTLISKYNIKKDGLVISPSTFIQLYLFGIPLTDINGNALPLYIIEQKIRWQTKRVENYLKLKMSTTEIVEKQDYIASEYRQWGHIKTEYIIQELLEVRGYINTVEVVEYPLTLFTTKGKSIAIVASTGTLSSFTLIGSSWLVFRSGASTVPDFWHLKYNTGFTDCPPEDILSVLGKFVAIDVLAVLGDILLGAGIASQSISMDGLSQSINTTQSAENSAYSARIRQYLSELKTEAPQVKDTYRGITFETL